MTKYLFDTNIFVDSKDKYYKPEFLMLFWDWLLEGRRQGCFYSIDKVKDELKKKKDFLDDFADNNPDFFLKTSVTTEYTRLIQWANVEWRKEVKPANNIILRDKARAEFSKYEKADPWLIAYAAKNNFTIVTHETSNQTKVKDIKIPDAANFMNVECITLCEVMNLHAYDNLKFKH